MCLHVPDRSDYTHTHIYTYIHYIHTRIIMHTHTRYTHTHVYPFTLAVRQFRAHMYPHRSLGRLDFRFSIKLTIGNIVSTIAIYLIWKKKTKNLLHILKIHIFINRYLSIFLCRILCKNTFYISNFWALQFDYAT